VRCRWNYWSRGCARFLVEQLYGIKSERIATGSLSPTLFACSPMIPPMCSSFAVSSPRSA